MKQSMRNPVAALVLTILAAAACQGAPASGPASDKAGLPPSNLERTMLGPDADNPFFLSRFRQCAAWASYTYCQADMYGGLTP
jgi:hypothetical protein